MKAHLACAYIFRRLKSFTISFLYLFASIVMAIFAGFARTLKVLEFENQNSRPLKSVKSTLDP